MREIIFLAMQDISFYTRILIAICVASVGLFFATRYILGRGVKISGDFWEHQNLAKSKVAWLNMLFFAMLALICLCAFSFFQMIFIGFGVDFSGGDSVKNRLDSLKISLGISVIFVLVLWLSYIFKNITMRKNGIDKLANALNADEIFGGQNNKEKTLFCVIEEMAIASNMPMPRVFIMRGENGINAMCSGERFGSASEKIAIFVTQGALDNFTRDELQGVIAHEFSHAFYGDVTLNLKIFSLIFALTWTMIIGEFFLRSCMDSSRTCNKNKSGGIIIIALIALVFYVLGFLGSIFAKIIQSAISRQKEFLADASSVQYTRNVNGIKSALKRIKNLQDNRLRDKSVNNISAVKNLKAKSCAHMFFLNSTSGLFSKIFATHPSLESRLKALDKIG